MVVCGQSMSRVYAAGFQMAILCVVRVAASCMRNWTCNAWGVVHEGALMMVRLLNNHYSRSVNVVDLRSYCNEQRLIGLDDCPTYRQLYLPKLLRLSQLVVGSPRRAFGGSCTVVVVSSRILLYI